MAKRSRGAVRPGQRRPTARPGQRPPARPGQPATRPAGALTREEEARAAELEAQILAQERAGEAARQRLRDRDRGRDVDAPAPALARGRTRDAGGGLALQAAQEYAYVVRDVRRIVVIGGALLGVMAVLFVLIEVAHIITI